MNHTSNDNNNNNNSNSSNDRTQLMPVLKSELEVMLNSIQETISMIPTKKKNHDHPIDESNDGGGSSSSIDPSSKGREQSNIKQNHDNTTATSASASSTAEITQIKSDILTFFHDIKNLVKPVEEDEYRKQFIKFDTPFKKAIHEHDNNILDNSLDIVDESSSNSSFSSRGYDESSSTFEDDDDEEEDEEDLIDQDALKRVKALREQVRLKAAQTKEVRDQKLMSLLENVSNQIQSLEKQTNNVDIDGADEGVILNSDDDNIDNDNPKEQVLEEQDNKQRLSQINDSLRKLTSLLQLMDMELPEKFESLKETIETIRHNIDRYYSSASNDGNDGENENGDPMEKLTGTERAILSRIDTNTKLSSQYKVNEKDKSMSLDQNNVGDMVKMDPYDRFAMFVSRVN